MKTQPTTRLPASPPLSSSDLLAAAEARRDLLMEVRRHFRGHSSLQWRAQAMDDMAEVIREAIKSANDRAHT